MGNKQRIITVSLWAVLLLTMVGVVVAKFLLPRGASRPGPTPIMVEALPILYPAPLFSFTDQDAKTYSTSDVRGHPWIAAFVFTRCSDVCPRITHAMVDLQSHLPPQARLVSFSVDPEFDTPAVLKAYAKENHADEARWRFLTGKKDAIFAFARGMKIPVEPATGSNPIGHSEMLTLIDADGNIRGYYDSNTPADMNRLVVDVAQLSRTPNSRPDGARP